MSARGALKAFMRETAAATIDFVSTDSGPECVGICGRCALSLRRQREALAKEIASYMDDVDFTVTDPEVQALFEALADRAIAGERRSG